MAGTRVPRWGCLFPAHGRYAWVGRAREADGGEVGGGGGGVGLRGEAARRSGAASEVGGVGLRCGGGGELSYLINAVRGFSENILRNRGVPPRGP